MSKGWATLMDPPAIIVSIVVSTVLAVIYICVWGLTPNIFPICMCFCFLGHLDHESRPNGSSGPIWMRWFDKAPSPATWGHAIDVPDWKFHLAELWSIDDDEEGVTGDHALLKCLLLVHLIYLALYIYKTSK